MSTIVTRAGKGSPLTNTEVDSNFTNLNTDKVESITSADGSVVVSTSGTTRDLSVGIAGSTATLISQVRNQTGATLTKGTLVYISGASGNKALVSKALATGDATSAQTYGMVQADIPHNQNGYVVVIGVVSGLDTSTFTEGVQLYLSPTTAGTYTSTKPYAPQHLVYVGVVTRSHANQGTIEVKIQNGYEMDEIHDVSAQSPTNGDTLVYNSTTTLWTKTAQSTLSVASAAAVPFSGVTSTPTTLSGYGITDAYSSSNPSGYITSSALSPYLTTATAASTYLPLAGGTLTGKLTLDGRNEVYGVPTNAGTIAGFMGGTSGGTTAARTQSLNTQTLLNIAALGYTGSAWVGGAGLSFVATENQAAGTRGTKAVLSAITTGDSTATTMEFNGSALTINGSTAVTSSNYTTYAPTLTGTGASGTWGISISGNSATTSQRAFSGDISTTGQGRFTGWYSGGAATGLALEAGLSGGVGYIIAYNRNTATYADLELDSANIRLLPQGGTLTGPGGNVILHAGNYNSYSPTLTGTGASGTWGISITGSAGSAGSASSATVAARLQYADGPRDLSDRLPNTFTRTVVFDFVGAGTGNGSGNYAGVMTYSPWTGTSASTGDSSYQLSFANTTGVNASGQPKLSIRNGIDSTWNAWYVLLHSGNYNSYSPTLTGTGASGTWGISITGTAGAANSATSAGYLTGGDSGFYGLLYNGLAGDLNTYDSPGLYSAEYTGSTNKPSGANNGHIIQISDAGGTDVKTQWYFPSAGVTPYMRLMWGNTNWNSWVALLTSGNYNSYSPTLTGGGASGTWGISVTGNSATVGGITPNQFFNNMGNNHTTYTNFNSVPNFGVYFIQGSTNSPTGIAGNQFYGFTLGLGNDYALSSYGSQIYYPRRAQNSETYIYVRDMEGSSWTSWVKIKAGYADTAGSAGSVDYNALTNKGGGTGSYITSGDYRAPIFYDSADTTYYVNPNGVSNLYNLTVGNYIQTQSYPGILILGNTGYNYNFLNGTWTSSVTAGILANCSDQWEMAIHDAGERVVSPFIFMGGAGSNYLLMGRDIGWGTTYIQAASSFRAPIFYDSDDTGYYVNPAGTSVLNLLGARSLVVTGSATDRNVVRAIPQGASASYNNVVTGAFKIRLPFRANDMMWQMTVKIYNYSDNNISEYQIGNYSYSAGSYNSAATFSGSLNAVARTVRLGNDGTYDCVWIGETAGTWSHPVIAVTDFMGGYANATAAVIDDNWEISLATTFGTIASTISPSSKFYSVTVDSAMYSPIYYDSDNTAYYLDPNATGTSLNAAGDLNFGNGGVNTGAAIYHGAGAGDYGRIRFYQAGTNNQTIHVFPTAWQSGTLQSASAGSINISGANGVTIGAWNNNDMWIDTSGNSQSRTSSRAPIFYDSNDTGYYLDPASTSRINRIDYTNLYYYADTNYGFLGPNVYADTINSGYAGDPLELCYYRGLYTTSSGSMRAPLFYDRDDTAYYLDPASTSNLNQVNLQGYLRRNTSAAGYLEGNYATSIDSNSSACIYTIGGSHQPTSTTMGNMYGIGYTVGNGTANPGLGMTGWGLYVASGGVSRIFLDSDSGTGVATASWRAPLFYDRDDTSYYLDAASTSVLSQLSFTGANHKYIYINPGNGYEAMVRYNGGTGSGWYVGKRTASDLVGTESFHFYSEVAIRTVAGIDTAGNTFAYGSSRAPLFYDSGNTAYYTDPASTSSLNRISTVRTDNWLYIDSNYGHSVVGVYSSDRYQGVFAMGDAYKLPANGTTTGSLYGMAWSHPNAGGAAGNLTDHGLLIINAGAFKCAISNSIVASANITAYSDERLKTNWRDMPEDYVTRLAQVKVGIYDRIDQEDVTQVGVSAQSFQELLPQAIMTAKDEMQTLSVSYGNAALASAVELAKEVVDLRNRVAQLESLIHNLIGD